MADYRCDRCRWAGHVSYEPTAMACRKDTPRIVEGGRVAVWPLVQPTDWCGHFTPRRQHPWTVTVDMTTLGDVTPVALEVPADDD